VTNSISRDRGSFKVSKSTTNPDGATLPAAFTGSYNCGTGYTGTWSVANGGSQTFSGIPTGSVCSVIEDTLAPISGYTWGTPSYSPATITISTKAGTFEIAVTNSISRDRGSFSFTKVLLNLEGAAVQATFPLSWDCGVDTTGAALTGKVDLAAGDTQTVSGIPTGNSCSVTEGMLGSVPLWTWQTPVITAAVIVGSDPETTGLVTVTNSISKDRGSFSFTKVLLNPEGAAVQATFPLSWDCGVDTTGAALTGKVDLAADATKTVSGIPTGNVCSVSEAALGSVPSWTWATPVITAAVTVGSDPATTDLVTVTNKITKDWLNLSLTKSVTSDGPYYGGANVTYMLVPHNDGPMAALSGWSVTEMLPAGSILVGLSGDGYTCYTNLVCISSTTLAGGADGNPITVVVQIPADLTGQFKNVAYVSPAENETAEETNPLVVPTIDTDTVASATDNDAEAVIDVLPPQPEGIVITLPNTGTTIPLTWLLAAIGILAAGVILLGASRFNARGRKN
jgi:hypothetical protein